MMIYSKKLKLILMPALLCSIISVAETTDSKKTYRNPDLPPLMEFIDGRKVCTMKDLVGRKRRPFMLGMSVLAADSTLCIVAVLRRLDNIRRRWLGRIGRVLRELSDFVRELSHLFGQVSNLLFKCRDAFIALFELRFEFRNALNVKLFCSGSQVLSSSLPTRLLSDKCGVWLEQNIELPP